MGIVRDDLEVTTVVPVEECCYICREGIAEFECDMPRMYAKAITTFHDKHSEMGGRGSLLQQEDVQEVRC